MIDNYLKSLQESFIFSDKTVVLDFDKFENGESNILLIAGISATGKTTLAERLSKELKCEFIETDLPCFKKNSDENYDAAICYRDIFRKARSSNKRYIIEGVLVFWSCLNHKNGTNSFFEECKHIPIILLGPSVLRAAYQGWKRAGSKEILNVMKWHIRAGIFDMYWYNIFRKARLNVPKTKVENLNF